MSWPDECASLTAESKVYRRLLLQEALILDVTEALARELQEQNMSKKELAEKLGKTKGYVSQILGGGRNLTLRTIADVADALSCRAHILLKKSVPRSGVGELLHFPHGNQVSEWKPDNGFEQVDYIGLEASTARSEVPAGA